MQIQPLGERIAIKVIAPEEQVGAIVVVTSKEKSNRGEVIALGDEVKGNIQVGDTVIFSIGTGVSYTSGNEDYKIISVKDVIGKLIKESLND